MRHAVISDVHSNLEALKAVLSDIDRRGIKDILFLGDAVGYGPDPDECAKILFDRCTSLVIGNHDMAACGMMDAFMFNPRARFAIDWTASVLSDESRSALAALPLSVESDEAPGILMVHSNPAEPDKWLYLCIPLDGLSYISSMTRPVCLLGHSHVPFALEMTAGGEALEHTGPNMLIMEGSRYIINAGSVGQPRDRDPRACYVVLDDGLVEFVRVEYPIAETQQKMLKADLPRFLIERLAHGV